MSLLPDDLELCAPEGPRKRVHRAATQFSFLGLAAEADGQRDLYDEPPEPATASQREAFTVYDDTDGHRVFIEAQAEPIEMPQDGAGFRLDGITFSGYKAALQYLADEFNLTFPQHGIASQTGKGGR